MTADDDKIRILIAEDSATQAAQLVYFLEKSGYAATRACNGREALDMLERLTPALVISDVVMPELDGYGLCLAIKGDARLRDIPVMLVTTLGDPLDVIKGLECGADNFLRKPYDEQYLLARVGYLLMNRELRRNRRVQMGVEISLGGQTHFITAERQQILDLLISTYEQAVRMNEALRDQQHDIGQLNDELELRIAERNASLETLHAKEEEVSAVLGNLLDCVITIDARGTVRSANPALTRVLGYRQEEVVGRNVSMIMPEPDRSAHDGNLERYLRTGEARIMGVGRDVEGLHKDGQLIPLHLAISEYAVRGERMFIGTLHDISARKRFVEELTRARADAEEANRAKSAFLAAMSHEIRTPMNGVIGMIEILGHSELSDYQEDLVKTIRESAGTLLALVDDILDFSKIEAGRLQIERAPVAVGDLVEGLCVSLAQVAARTGVDLNVFVSPDVPGQVLSDDVRLRQVIYNLAGNAIKFSGGRSDKRGRVSLRVEAEAASPLRLAIRIADNGIGMTPETLQHLFTPFTQAESSTTRLFGGTGLGLAICKRLVTLMQGEISVDSTPGAGSTFTVTLPVDAVPDAAPRLLPDLADLDCIVVAGSDFEADDLCRYLSHEGARVRLATDLDEAARIASGLGLTVVILDAGQDAVATDHLPQVFGQAPEARLVLLKRNWHGPVQVGTIDAVTVDGDALRRQSLLRAVAVAAGRASPEMVHDSAWKTAIGDVQAPTVAEARALGRLILVAEDNEINRKVIRQQLGLLGYATEIAGNGTEALRLWRENHYALLFTDLHMPEMDGYTLAESIRREENGGPRLPILALTANALRGEARRAEMAGMDGYLTKPVQLPVLKAALDKWLPNALPAASPGHADGAITGAVVDVAVLKGLVGDDETIVNEFLADYLTSAKQLAAELRDAWTAADVRKVGVIAHKLKSSSRSVGALRLGNLCAALEDAGKAGDKAAIERDAAQFEVDMASVDACITEFLAGSHV